MNEPAGDWANTVVDLLGVAARLEGHGQINVAKLARAVADALLRRAAYTLDLPADPQALVTSLNQLTTALPAFGVSEDVTQALARGATAISGGRLPLYDEIPAPFVCRTCGEATMTPPSAPCPVCGAWPTTFQRFQPVYWLDELSPFEALAQLRATPDVVAHLLSGLTEEQLARPAVDGGWSMRQVVSHLRDAEGVLRFRVQLMAEQDNPVLESQAVFAWATSEENRPPTTAEILQTYQASREESLGILESLPVGDWQRRGQHTEFGPVTILQQASYFAAHEQTHLASLARLRAI